MFNVKGCKALEQSIQGSGGGVTWECSKNVCVTPEDVVHGEDGGGVGLMAGINDIEGLFQQ